MPDRLWRLLAYGALALGTVGLLTGLLAWAAVGRFSRGPQILVLWGLALLAVFVVLEFETLGQLISGRGLRGSGNIGVRILAVLGIVVLLNVLAAQHVFKRDLTALRVNTLAPQTLKVLHGLKEPVEADAFYRPTSAGQADARKLLERYQRENPANFRVNIIDPDQRPDLAIQLGANDGTVVFRTANHPPEKVQSAQEQDFTSALIKLSSSKSVKVYFLTGHGEGQSTGLGGGITLAKQGLQREGFTIEDLNLLGDQPKVPPDAAAVVIAGGKRPLGDPEVRALVAYLDGGGRALVMNAPLENTDFNRILDPYGLSFDLGVVADPGRHAQQTVFAPVAATYPFSLITRDLSGENTFMFNAGAVRKRDTQDVTQTALWDTSADAYEVSDKNLTRPFDPSKDKKGPFTLLMSAERKAPEPGPSPGASPKASPSAPPASPATRVVAAGSWEFASDRIIGSGANGPLFFNTVNWLVGQEQLISIPPRQNVATVALDSGQRGMIFLGTVVLLPALILLAGVAVWARRALRR